MFSIKKCFTLISLSLSLAAVSVTAEEELKPISLWVNSNLDGEINREKYADIPIEKLRKDDFYAAVNFDWLCDTEIDADKLFVNTFDEALDNASMKMRELLENHQLEGVAQEYYDCLTDWDTREAVWKTTLEPHVQILKDIQTLDDLKEYLLSEESVYYGNVFDTFDVEQQDSYYFLMIQNSFLYSCTVDDEPMNSLRKGNQFYDILKFLLPQFGYSEEESETVVGNAMNIERTLSDHMYTSEEKQDPSILNEEMYWNYSLEGLAKAFPDFPIAEMLTVYGYTDFSGYVVEEPMRLWCLEKLFTEEHVDAFRDYLLCTMLMNYVPYAGLERYQEYCRIGYEDYGYKEFPSLEKLIFEEVAYECPNNITNAFIEYYMTPEIKEDVTALVERIKATYIALVSDVEWLSDETKDKAIKKLEDMDMFVAYADDFEYEPSYFGEVDGDINLFTWIQSDLRDAHDYILEKMQECISQKEEQAETSEETEEEDSHIEKQQRLARSAADFEVNAFYSHEENAIIIPALILTEPFYSIDMTEEEKMGKIGMIIAHEISHAFGPKQVEYDDGGTQMSWWGEEDQQYYDTQVSELVTYLNRLVVLPDGTLYSGEKVKNETIADILAMQCMIRMANKDLTFNYRDFFEAFASIYREKNTAWEERALVESTDHPLHYLRVNITVSQFPEFQQAYHLKPGDGMYNPAPPFTFWDTLDVLDHYETMLEDYGSLPVYLPDEKPELKDDFYYNINYDSLSKLYLPDDRTDFTISFSSSANQVISRDISDYAINTILRKDPSSFEEGSLRQKIWDIYQCASDKEARSAIGWEPIRGWLQQIDEMETIEDYLDYEAEINSYGLYSLLNCKSVQSVIGSDNRPKSVFKIKNRYIAFPDGVWINGEQEVFDQFSSDIQTLLESVGYGKNEAQEATARLIQLIKDDSASISVDGELKYMNQPYSLEELQELFPAVDIKSFLSKIGRDNEEAYYIDSLSYIEHLNEMLTNEHMDEIKLYAKAMLLYDLDIYGPALIHEIGDAENICAYINSIYNSQIRTSYIQELATEETVSYMEQLAYDIIATYKEMIDEQTWLSDVTKENMKNALDGVTVNVAVPKMEEENILNFDVVPLSEGGSWLQNQLDFAYARTQKEIKSEEKTTNQVENWANDNMQVMYQLVQKRLDIPAILLQQPYYYGSEADEANMSILGMSIANQLSGVILPTNRTMTDHLLMTEEEMEEYNRRISYIADYFNHYEILPDHFMDGDAITYGMSRVFTAFDVMIRLMEKKGLGREKLYTGFAFSRMEAINEETLAQRLENSSAYLPDSIRVNYILRNIDDFYDTYGITENDNMYLLPDSRVQIWN